MEDLVGYRRIGHYGIVRSLDERTQTLPVIAPWAKNALNINIMHTWSFKWKVTSRCRYLVASAVHVWGQLDGQRVCPYCVFCKMLAYALHFNIKKTLNWNPKNVHALLTSSAVLSTHDPCRQCRPVPWQPGAGSLPGTAGSLASGRGGRTASTTLKHCTPKSNTWSRKTNRKNGVICVRWRMRQETKTPGVTSMKNQVLHIVWRNISGKARGDIRNWSLSRLRNQYSPQYYSNDW